MRTGLTKQEKTTDIWFDEKDPLIHIRTHNTALKKRLAAYAEQITRFCEAKGLFPQVMQYDDQERFFETAQKADLTNAVIALSGVAGLNAAEHLRSLCPACRMIWCSDLDFSLHAFRLRADYFLMKPVSEEAFQRGLNAWIE